MPTTTGVVTTAITLTATPSGSGNGNGLKVGDTTGRSYVTPITPTPVQAQPVTPQYTNPSQVQGTTQAGAQVQYPYAQQQQAQQSTYMMQHRIQDRSLTTGAGLTPYASTMETEKLPPETSTFSIRTPNISTIFYG